jgi:hypothetical protein
MGPYGPAEYTPSRKEGNKPPSAPGEYRIISNTGKVKYIGETADLNRRMGEHRRAGESMYCLVTAECHGPQDLISLFQGITAQAAGCEK